VVQHVFHYGDTATRLQVVQGMECHFFELSQHNYSSNAVEILSHDGGKVEDTVPSLMKDQ
jgi:hypothetical protein